MYQHLPLGYRCRRQPMKAAKWEIIQPLYDAVMADESMAAKALRFLILTCAPRASEVIDLRWKEISLSDIGAVWTVPLERMKGRVARQIPLSEEAVELLLSIQPAVIDPEAYVFEGQGGWVKTPTGVRRDGVNGRIGVHAMLNLLRDHKLHVHGFRASFKSFVLDNKRHVLDVEAMEISLDHAIGNAVQEAYRDTGLLRHRRILAARWACWLTRREYVGSFGAPLPEFVQPIAA